MDKAYLDTGAKWLEEMDNQMKRLRNENDFFRQLLYRQISETAVFDQEGMLFFSTIQEMPDGLLELLRQEIQETLAEKDRRITRVTERTLYTIHAYAVSLNESAYAAFFFTSRKVPLSNRQTGIRFLFRTELEQAVYESVFIYAGAAMDYQEQIEIIRHSSLPVLISGENGTGKEYMAYILHMNSSRKNNAFVRINCGQLNEKSWKYLLEHQASPLLEEGNTICFMNLNALSHRESYQLMAALMEMEVCERNHVLFVSRSQVNEDISATGAFFADGLGCIKLPLHSMRRAPERIPSLVNMTLNHLRTGARMQPLNVEEIAMAQLQRYSWPYNYAQFERVMRQLAETVDGDTVKAEQVGELLAQERYPEELASLTENRFTSLDLNNTLEEITREVAHHVVKDCGGNQTIAARRLAISRTTMWRLLKEK